MEGERQNKTEVEEWEIEKERETKQQQLYEWCKKWHCLKGQSQKDEGWSEGFIQQGGEKGSQ